MPAIWPNAARMWAGVETRRSLLLLLLLRSRGLLASSWLAPDVRIGLLEADLDPDHLL
eukprot:SAG11_NODE_8967_length_958_cov_1.123399_3_plen_57_part_01